MFDIELENYSSKHSLLSKLRQNDSVSTKEFETSNLLPVRERFKQCTNSLRFKYVSCISPNYLNKVFEIALDTIVYYCLLKAWFQKATAGQNSLSCIKYQNLRRSEQRHS